MSVHQLKDGRWFVHYPKGTVDGDPERTREYFGRGEAARIAAENRNRELGFFDRPAASRKARRDDRSRGGSFFAIAGAYLAAKDGRMPRPSFEALSYKLGNVILPEIGHLPAAAITHHRIDQYVAKRLKTPVRVAIGVGPGRKIKKSRQALDADGLPRRPKLTTIHREISDIQAILNWAAKPERGLISRNPLAGYEKPRRDDAIIPPPTATETRAILAHASEHLVRALTLSYFTGLRPGRSELLKIRWDQVDLEAKTILVMSARKGGPAARLIPLHPQFSEILAEWKKADGKDGSEGDYIITYRGRPVARIIKSFAAAKRRAGIGRRLRPYDFRHAFATALLTDNADPRKVSELIGHSRVDTTLSTYNHTTTALNRAVIDRLPRLDRDP